MGDMNAFVVIGKLFEMILRLESYLAFELGYLFIKEIIV